MLYAFDDHEVVLRQDHPGFVLIPAGERHNRVVKSAQSVVLGFQLEIGDDKANQGVVLDLLRTRIEGHRHSFPMPPELSPIVTRLAEELEFRKTLAEMKIAILLQDLLVTFFRYYFPREIGYATQQRPGRKARRNELLHFAELYIDENINRSFSLPEVAAFCGVSTRHLTRLFVEGKGVLPGTYVSNRKMALAKDDLRHSDKMVKTIAIDLG